MSDTYLHRMFARLITMLAILAIAVVTSGTAAHAARMSVEPDRAVHVGEMMQGPHNSERSCDGDRHCGLADAGMCQFVCAGLSAFLPPPGEEAEHEYRPASHDLPSGVTYASRAPALDEHPPKLRLL